MPITSSYHSFPRINLRSADRGGPILRSPQVVPRYLLINADELLFLIHGYNNDRDEAFASYSAFLGNLGYPWRKLAAGLFWPGDGISYSGGGRSPGLLSRVCGIATYSWQPLRTQEAANYLNELLISTNKSRTVRSNLVGRMAPPLTLNIVAHSMGCRLALELLRLVRGMASLGHLRVRSVTLMAAAVPIYQVEERGILELALETAETTRVLWSKADTTLKYWFRPGQSLERHVSRGFLKQSRQALGRDGIVVRHKVHTEKTSLNHSEYWNSPLAADRVREDLIPRGESFPVSNTLVPRTLPIRKLGERHLRGNI